MAITDKRYLSGDEYLRDTWRLAAQVRESGWQPDILIALWRGGAPVGVARKGDKVLVVDDVFDTGKTAKAVKEQIGATGAEMRLACVYWKPGKNTTDLKPDYFYRDVGNEWIVFPHEIEGLTKEEIAVKDPLLSSLLGSA